ncbi:GDSL-type esterase/lipase family protein [Stenotrophomonas sp. 24(2023)]|uniref:SGNH/GDSL hydrolase family protein n=1 Tax=Stenotrophomonas sp. 24(2023) TaxID=3068324 RepID=UPI0027DFA6DF|nr:GDSL-type esterase/lipase family protein [Stenotrophomonas sp. 24(2023)]WMJ67732.1 GDSL-type esterase/lipase family protein [Stenotrophomonas sp. 24(2023)]
MIRTSLLALALCLATGCTRAPTPVVAPPQAAAATPAPAGPPCLAAVIHDLQQQWPGNATVNIVAFGHSVPAGYGTTPQVQKRDAYPRLLEDALANAYPYAVLNVITAGVGGENSTQGRARFQRDALDHHPRVVLIDYGLNDRALPLAESTANLEKMIEASRAAGACPVLLTPTWDEQADPQRSDDTLAQQATMIRQLGHDAQVPVADSLAAFQAYPGDRAALMAQFNHPNRQGHQLVLERLLPLFLPTPP